MKWNESFLALTHSISAFQMGEIGLWRGESISAATCRPKYCKRTFSRFARRWLFPRQVFNATQFPRYLFNFLPLGMFYVRFFPACSSKVSWLNNLLSTPHPWQRVLIRAMKPVKWSIMSPSPVPMCGPNSEVNNESWFLFASWQENPREGGTFSKKNSPQIIGKEEGGTKRIIDQWRKEIGW